LSKQEADLSATNRDSLVFDLDKKIADMVDYKDTHTKYIKRTVPALIHIPDGSTSAAWKRPCLIRHRLHPYLSFTLDSPLVSIYHQLEVTFQFGMKYEEVKTKIPIIIASIPRKELTPAAAAAASDEDLMMMKYAFEEVARSEFLTYKLESRSSTQRVTDDDYSNPNNDNYSVLRDTNLMSPTSEDDNRSGRVTPMMFVKQNGRLPPAAIPSPAPMSSYRRALSPTPASNTTLTAKSSSNRQLKKFASAFDLSTSSQESPHPLDYDEPPEERPRTTTPTMRRHNMMRKLLQPINVDLANGKEFRPPHPPPQTELPPPPPPQTELPPPPPTSNTLDSSSSDVLPAIDRAQQPSNRKNNTNKHWAPQDAATSTPINCNMSIDDLRSIYSDTTSISSVNIAPSLSSSATLSTNKSQPTLHSRPPSPVFSPAPGLPATIALRPQQDDVQAVEETFPSDSAMSPAMNTVASSTILTPRTSYALRRRIALSTISSLTNDSLQLGPSMTARARSSSTVDPDVQSLLMQYSSRYSSSISSVDYPPPPINRYAFARLPPIPTTSNSTSTTKANRRMTKLYMEDSDDEDSMMGERSSARSPSPPPLPQLQQASFAISTSTSSNNNNNNNTSEQEEDCAPPRLPRLSFGKDFGISLGI
jgi:hypothetical protein